MNVGMKECVTTLPHKPFVFLSSRASLDRAAVLLKMSMGGLRIDNQWGTGGGQRPVIQLIKEVGKREDTGSRLALHEQ